MIRYFPGEFEALTAGKAGWGKRGGRPLNSRPGPPMPPRRFLRYRHSAMIPMPRSSMQSRQCATGWPRAQLAGFDEKVAAIIRDQSGALIYQAQRQTDFRSAIAQQQYAQAFQGDPSSVDVDRLRSWSQAVPRPQRAPLVCSSKYLPAHGSPPECGHWRSGDLPARWRDPGRSFWPKYAWPGVRCRNARKWITDIVRRNAGPVVFHREPRHRMVHARRDGHHAVLAGLEGNRIVDQVAEHLAQPSSLPITRVLGGSSSTRCTST